MKQRAPVFRAAVWATVLAFALLVSPGVLRLMADTPPTFSSITSSTYSDGLQSETTGTLTWTTGDLIVVMGITADNNMTINVPTGGGVGTFTQATVTATASNCKVYIWSGTTATTSSGTITATTNSSGANNHGMTAYAITGSAGLGNTQLMASTASTNPSQNLTRANSNSGVILAFGDWTPVADNIVVSTPSANVTQDIINNIAGYRYLVSHWTDQGASGTTAYGIGSGDSGSPKWIGAMVEIKGTSSGTPAAPQMLTLGVR